MPVQSRRRTLIARKPRGAAQIAEFAAALIMLIGLVFLPLLDMTIVPIRWMLAQEIVSGYARKLALCETFQQSYKAMQADPSLAKRLRNLGGVSVDSIKLYLRISRVFPYPHAEEATIVSEPGRIPSVWLPDGDNKPCAYSLCMEIHAMMSPAILLPSKDVDIPGLTRPFPVVITASHEWENLGRNPATGNYYVNE